MLPVQVAGFDHLQSVFAALEFRHRAIPRAEPELTTSLLGLLNKILSR